MTTLIDVGIPPGMVSAQCVGIRQDGQVVVVTGTDGSGINSIWRWDGAWLNIGVLNAGRGDSAIATGIDATGTLVVGVNTNGSNGHRTGVLWSDPGPLTEIEDSVLHTPIFGRSVLISSDGTTLAGIDTSNFPIVLFGGTTTTLS